MLTLIDSTGTRHFAVEEGEEPTIRLARGCLDIKAHLDGFSFLIERARVPFSRELDLAGKTLVLEEERATCGELYSHDDEGTDYLLDGKMSFERIDLGLWELRAEGRAVPDDDAPEDAVEAHFTLSLRLRAIPVKWQLELAFGQELQVEPDILPPEEVLNRAVTHLRDMASARAGATELVVLYDGRDDTALRCYGQDGRLIFETTLGIEGKTVNGVVARHGEQASTVSIRPDSGNEPIEAQSDELFELAEAEALLRRFFAERAYAERYLVRPKTYLF